LARHFAAAVLFVMGRSHHGKEVVMSRRLSATLIGFAFVLGFGLAHARVLPRSGGPGPAFGSPCVTLCPACDRAGGICHHLSLTQCICE
jgi:hypothetical protein